MGTTEATTKHQEEDIFAHTLEERINILASLMLDAVDEETLADT